MKLQHRNLPTTAIVINVERNVLWFGRDEEDFEYEELGEYYGPELSLVQNAFLKSANEATLSRNACAI